MALAFLMLQKYDFANGRTATDGLKNLMALDIRIGKWIGVLRFAESIPVCRTSKRRFSDGRRLWKSRWFQ